MNKKDLPQILPGMIDSHFHIHHSLEKGVAINEILTQSFQNGMYRVMDVGTEPDDIATRWQMVKSHPGVLMSAGCSPAFASSTEFVSVLQTLLAALSDTPEECPIVAIGEIGLDYHWMYGTKDIQQALCTQQIEFADKLGLPVILHVRDAHADMHSLLQRKTPIKGGVIHCFSGSVEDAKRYVDLGLLVSFSGSITFKNAAELRECAAGLPSTSILAETDSPYLNPVPLRGKPNNPSRVAAVYETIAEARKTDIQELIEVVKRNFIRLFGTR